MLSAWRDNYINVNISKSYYLCILDSYISELTWVETLNFQI